MEDELNHLFHSLLDESPSFLDFENMFELKDGTPPPSLIPPPTMSPPKPHPKALQDLQYELIIRKSKLHRTTQFHKIQHAIQHGLLKFGRTGQLAVEMHTQMLSVSGQCTS